MKNHLSKLRNNLIYGANISYFFKKGLGILKSNIGIGMKYSGTYTNILSKGIPYKRVKDNSIIYSMLSEKFETHYIGAFLETRGFLGKNKHYVFGNVGIGYIRYNNDAKIAYEDVKIIGNSTAFSAEIGCDFLITKNFAIGLQTSFMLGFVDYLVDNVKPITPQKENMSHLNITLGFRFYR